MPQGPMAANIATRAGAYQPAGLGKTGDLLIGQSQAQYYEQAYGQMIGQIMNPSAVTTSAALATTYVGLCLSNPAGNTKNLVLLRVAGAFIVAPSTITNLGLITGYAAGGITAHTTALAPFNGLIGTGAALTAKADSACTLVGTPVWTMTLGQAPTATTSLSFNVDLGGAIILPPGAYAAIGTNIAGPASGFQGSFEWAETPV